MIKNFEEDYFKLVEAYCEKQPIDPEFERAEIQSVLCRDLKEGKQNFQIIGGLGIEPIGDPNFTSGETIYVGSTILTNKTNIDQKIRTESFSRQESFTTTSKTTNGFKLGVKGSAKFSVKFFGNGMEMSTDISAEYNFASEKTNTTSETHTLVIPSQEILVPAKSRIQVTAIFNKGCCSGKVLLKALLRGDDTIGFVLVDKYNHEFQYVDYYHVPFDKLARVGNIPDFKPVPNSYNDKDYTGEMEVIGAGEYESSLATNFIIELKQFDLSGKEVGKCRSYPVKTVLIK